MTLWTIHNKKEEKFLRRTPALFDFAKHTKKEIRDLIKTMRSTMKKANGIGLSANQIGLDMRVFVAQPENKFYAVFNPEILKTSGEAKVIEEGCLSVPDVYGNVTRPDRVLLSGYDANGNKIKIKAWGILARVFQHEVDHLNGGIFIDKATEIHTYQPETSDKDSDA